MMSLRNLIDFLPQNYKEEDTYKVDGKGLLERFLEIFGNYFEDYIVNDTSSILDLIDIAHTPEIYLNYLWEFLGELPFAYGNHIDAEKWKTYFNGFDDDEKIEELSELWLVPKDTENLFYLPPYTIRKVLRYSISLFKIRGTERFFKIFLNLFNIDITFSNYPSFDTEYNDSVFDKPYFSIFDSGYTFDKHTTCEGCVKVKATIELLPALENQWLFNDNRNILWNNGGFINIDEKYPTNIPITTWEEIDHTIKAIFERFLPVDVRVDISYDYEPENQFLVYWEVLNIDPTEPGEGGPEEPEELESITWSTDEDVPLIYNPNTGILDFNTSVEEGEEGEVIDISNVTVKITDGDDITEVTLPYTLSTGLTLPELLTKVITVIGEGEPDEPGEGGPEEPDEEPEMMLAASPRLSSGNEEEGVEFSLGRNIYAKIKVQISDYRGTQDIKFRLCHIENNSSRYITDKIHNNDSIVEISVPGQYIFMPCNQYGDLYSLKYDVTCDPQEILKITK